MKLRSKLFAAAALVVATAFPVAANIAAPKVEPTPRAQRDGRPVRMQIRPDAEAKEAKLIIPRAVFEQLKAELDGDDSQAAAAAATAPGGFNPTPTQTAVAGLFLSLSLVAGGVWLVNLRASGRRVSRVASALLLVALGGAAGATAVYANAGPPPVARSLTSKILIPDLSYWGASGTVKVEVVKDESLIMLVLPKSKNAAEGE